MKKPLIISIIILVLIIIGFLIFLALSDGKIEDSNNEIDENEDNPDDKEDEDEIVKAGSNGDRSNI